MASNCQSDKNEAASCGSMGRDGKDVPGTTGSDWSNEEQTKLAESLVRYAAHKFTPGERYMHLAAQLPNRTARDVALRVKWLDQHSRSNQPKASQSSAGPILLIPPAQQLAGLPKECAKGAAGQASLPSYSNRPQPSTRSPSDEATDLNDPFTSGLAALASGIQLEANAHQSADPMLAPMNALMRANFSILDQFKVNMASYKVVETAELLMKFRDNLSSMMGSLNELTTSGHLVEMAQLPVKPNLDLANSFLPNVAASLPPGMGAGGGVPQGSAPMPQQAFNRGFLTAGGNPLPHNSLPMGLERPGTSLSFNFSPDVVPDLFPGPPMGDLELENLESFLNLGEKESGIVGHAPHEGSTIFIHAVCVIFMLAGRVREATPIIAALGLQQDDEAMSRTRPSPCAIYSGRYNNLDVHVVSVSKCEVHQVDSVGTVPAALCAFCAISALRPDLVIDVGNAEGCMTQGAEVGDIFVSSSTMFHDRRTPMAGNKQAFVLGAIPSQPSELMCTSLGLKRGVISSGNSLDLTSQCSDRITQHKVAVKDMTAAAVAWSCNLHGVPFFSLKAIDGIVDAQHNGNSYDSFAQNEDCKVGQVSATVLKVLLFVAGKAFNEL
eukprot:gene8317-1592_t